MDDGAKVMPKHCSRCLVVSCGVGQVVPAPSVVTGQTLATKKSHYRSSMFRCVIVLGLIHV